LLARALHFLARLRSWPGPARPRPLSRAASDRGRGSSPCGRHAPRRRHLAARWPSRPTRSPTPSAPRPPPLLTPHSLPSLHRSSSASRAAFLHHRPRNSSPELSVPATSDHCHRLHLSPSIASFSRSPRLPQLPVVSFPSVGIARRSPGRAHRRTPLRGHLRSASPPALFSRAQAPHCVPNAPEHLHSPCRGRESLTSDDPRRRSAMHGGGRLFELPGTRHGHRRVRARVGSTLVTLAWPKTSPSPRSHRSVPPRFGLADGWGPLDPRAHLSVSLC
jgi:hypothetical protein